MQRVFDFLEANRPLIEAAEAMSAALNIVGWLTAIILMLFIQRRIRAVSIGPLTMHLREAEADAIAAVRSWRSIVPSQKVDVPRVHALVGRVFAPKTIQEIVGKSVLWVDDNPQNNALAVRTFEKWRLVIRQVGSTSAALDALQERKFDLIISDMGRGENMTAGYELLQAVRTQGLKVPFFIFAGSDTPEYRRQAAALGAQLSTNDMLELMEQTVEHLKASN